jgi:lipoprotein-anchoring transpeptidase ErfK/SrfK
MRPTRRALLAGLAAILPASATHAQSEDPIFGDDPDFFEEDRRPTPPGGGTVDDWYVGTIPDHPHPIPIVDPTRIHPDLRRQLVRFDGPERAGMLVVDPGQRYLYVVREDGTALRYGIGVGRMGFGWAGDALIRRKAVWPDWRPPAEMRKRQPELPAFVAGGPENPLGARALYLFQGEKDTLYRIHGTMEPWTIGEAVSSGCIRLLNEDIYDLHRRVPVGTPVTVRRSNA